MALEFKGIKANSLRLMANHDKLNTVLASAVESSDKLISHVGDFKGMSDGMVEDIEFAANVLGNSQGRSGESEKPKEKAGETQVITPADVGKIGQGLVSGSPEVETPATFPEA